jgi:glycerophosphoryl diester phosphodiesterase
VTTTLRTTAISAHRGASAEHPENTLAAFEAALRHGTDGIELDVSLSADGVPVVMHDPTVDRTTDGTGAVADLPLAVLRALDTGAGPVPTLDEVLGLAAGHAEVNVELKTPVAAWPALAVAARHPDLTWFASAADWAALRNLRALDPDVRLYPLSMAVTDAALAFADEIAAEGLSLCETGLTAPDLVRVRAAGLRSWVWTVNDRARAAALTDCGVDTLCTDDPGGLLGLLTTSSR